MVDKTAASVIKGALDGTEGRRGIWTDRDYLVHALAHLEGVDVAREYALIKPHALLDGNKPPRFADKPWWAQYEEMADKLSAKDDTECQLAADDIRTLVDGLRDLERKLGERPETPDPAKVD